MSRGTTTNDLLRGALLGLALASGPVLFAQEPGADDAPAERQDGSSEEREDEGAAADAERAAALARAEALSELATLLELGLVGDAIAFGLPLVATGGSADDDEAGALAGDGRAVSLVARALYRAGREEEALRLLQDAALDPATGGWVELEWARIAIARDELDTALTYLVEKDGSLRLPNIDQSWMLTGRTLFRRGNLQASARFLEGFVERAPFHPDTVSAYHMLALEAVQRRDTENAVAYRAESDRRRRAFELVRARSLQVRANPKDALPRYGLGLAFLELGDAEMAVATLRGLLREHPEFQRAYFQYGEALRATGRRDLAIAAFGDGLERDADDHKCRLNRGLVLAELGRFDAALEDFELLLTSDVADDPLFAGLYLGLTRVYDARGERTAGDEAYARYRELGGEQPR